jgi:hypothetical protein
MKFHENCPVETTLIYTNRWIDRRTDKTQQIGTFRDYVNAPNY